MVRAFRSELIKLGRWSVLAGGAAMIVLPVAFSYLQANQALSSGRPSPRLAAALPTSQGLITVMGGHVEPLMMAIAVILVTANVAAEWSQSTLRNLLVREPRRLHLLAGKMLALLLLVVITGALALLAGAGAILAAASSNGVSTAPWTSADGINTFLSFFGNELLNLVGASLLGMFIAVLTRSASAAVGISLAYVLAGEVLIGAVWSGGAQWLPVHLFGYLPGVTGEMSYGLPPMGYTSDLIAALLWMVGLIVVSFVAFRLMDISS
jgi:ABC-2 type transport system permease protein